MEVVILLMRYRVAVVLLAQIGSLCNNDDAKDDA